MRGWAKFGRRGCELVEMPGGHFFLDTHRRSVLEVINARLGVHSGPVGV
jgi:surfactin synthase thioesterase subunit